MKITDIDFIHAPELCGHWWIHVHTDEGVTGLGGFGSKREKEEGNGYIETEFF